MLEPGRFRTTHLGQFRLTRLQVVNWGTFCGYKDFAIDERGVLFTGPSGSGKSSLMDAHSTALLPTTDQRFNASADMTARGAKQSTRSVADYVRGAWSQTSDENEQSQVQYLRGGKPTWSAVAATYDNGVGRVTTAVVVKWFTGVETDGASLKTMHQLYEGQFDLTELQAWAEREFDTRWFKAAHPSADYPPSQSGYMRALADRVGLGSSRTGVALLGKAKAMKNVGDLNLFIRGNMLDEPETFAAAERVLRSFTPLNEAYETASRAHAQEQVLRDVPNNWDTYRRSQQTSGRAAALLGTSTDIYLRRVLLQAIEPELNRLDKRVADLDAQLQKQKADEQEAYDKFVSLDRQWREDSQPLQALGLELAAANTQADARRAVYQVYEGHVTRLERACPQNAETFEALHIELPRIRRDAETGLGELGPQRHEKFAAAADARRLRQEAADELAALDSARSLIPPRASQRREAIAAGAGVPVAALSYAAELIDVAPEHERWRPAAEKLLRTFGLRLLVPEVHKEAVRRFIDKHDMGGIVEYSIVTGASAHRPRPGTDTLAARLIVNLAHPSGAWLAGQVVQMFDHVCVERARDLEPHRKAVTVRGTVKVGGNHYRKDDRPEVVSPASYILGANIATKREALRVEVSRLAQNEQATAGEAENIDGRYRSLEAAVEAAKQVATYEHWSDLDFWTPRKHARELAKRIESLKADNVDLQRLEQQRDDAEEEYKRRTNICAGTSNEIGRCGDQQTSLIETYEREEPKPHTITNDDDRAYLDEVLESLDIPAEPGTMSQVGPAFRKELGGRRDAAEAEHRLAATKIKNAIGQFIEKWPDAAPDTSGDVERSGGDFAALHNDIADRRLPDAMKKFQDLITEDMVPSIGLLQRAIEKASDEIRDRITMVNAGLRRVEFNTETHLQIAYKASRPTDVAEFRKAVDTLLRNAPAARRDPNQSITQFRRVRGLMARLGSDDLESRRWRANVLDVRNSYTFYGREEDTQGQTISTYQNTASNSGGEQEKLVAFCLAAALSYNLADADSDGRPRFAPLMLDEAFSKSDETFASQALSVFEEFGFQLLIAAPIRMSGIVEPFIGQAILVEKRMTPDGAHSNAASATFGELAARRDAEMEGGVRAAA